jgi:hypothetical protein
MQVAARRHVTAGIALAGAAVIAVSPIAPTLPDIHVPGIHAAQVELAALTNPLEQWAQVIGTVISNAGALGAQLQSDPDPIIQKIIDDQQVDGAVLGQSTQTTMTALNNAVMGLPSTLQTAAGQLQAGDVTGAAQTVGTALLPLVLGLVDGFNQGFAVVTNTAQNMANVVAAVPSLVLPALLAISGPIFSTVNADATTGQELVDAVGAGDIEGVANTLINSPAALTGALLNGFGNGPLGLPSPGLLSPTGPLGALSAGTISGLLSLRDTIAAALDPLPTPASATATLQPKQLSGTPVGELPSSTSLTAKVTVASPEASPSTGTETAKPSPTKSDVNKDTADSTTAKADDTSSDTGASTGTPAKPSTPTSGPKHQAPTGNGANSTASRPHDQGTKGSTDSHSTAKHAAKHGSK